MTLLDTELPPRAPQKKKRFMWGLLAILLLSGAGSVALSRCQFLYPTPPQNTSDTAQLEKHIQALETKINALTEISATNPQMNVVDAANSDALKNLQAEVVVLQNQGSQGQQSTRKWVGVAMAFWDLRDAAKSGHVFTSQLAVLRANADDDTVLLEGARKLEPFAAENVPTSAQLREALLSQEEGLSDISETQDQSIWGRLKAIFHPLISVHDLHNTSYGELEKALLEERNAQALEIFKTLPEQAQKKLSVWHVDLEKRVALDDVLHEMAAAFTASAPQEQTP